MNESSPNKLAKFISSNKNIFIIFYVILLVSSLAVIGQRALSDEPFADNSARVWFNTNDPDLLKFDRFSNEFGNQEWGSILIKTKDIYNKEFLNELSEVTEEIEALSVVYRATSLANVRGNRTEDEDSLWFTSIFESDGSSQWNSNGEFDQFKERLHDNKFIKNLLYKAGDNQHTFILIQSEDRKDEPGNYRQEYVKDIYTILQNRDAFEEVKFQGGCSVNCCTESRIA